jgi:DNA-binding CsgD family transcriptional regulator
LEDRRHGEGRASSAVEAAVPPEARGTSGGRDSSSWVNWQSALYVIVLGAVCLVLVPLTSLWWIVPVLGALVPVALAVLDGPGPKLGRTGDKKSKERELLNVLAERDEITPATAAMRTSLTVDEASKMLGDLAGKGHLKLQAEDGIMAYALPDRDRLPAAGVPPERLDDPLSERELEVLTLLASGRTNAEIARDLFVAVGTVKSHVNNIYRKLDAANRAEAVTRARELELLR